ncbi:cysteine desulfurase NifS [Myxococcota bacterium]|nr:cysteine desulfurase NifS [Myxococcota bacterium]
MTQPVIYLDNNATTRVAPEVFESMVPFLTDLYGNPSSMHDFGGNLQEYVEEARAQVAALIGAEDPSEIIFTSCGTEADNTAIASALRANPGKKHIITSKVEHPAVLNYFEYLENSGYEVTWLPVDGDGLLDADRVEAAIRDDTALCSLMWANNETGVIFPIDQIGERLKKHGVMFHTDAVQAVGKIPIDLSRTPVDMLSLSGHKFHAPKGIGALYVRRGTMFYPYLIGGHQERGRRSGTTPVPLIAAIGTAAKLAIASMESEATSVSALRDRLEEGIRATVPGIVFVGDRKNRLPNTANISFEYVEGEAILLMLSEENIAASSGSACSSDSLEPSHVLRAMGLPFELCHASIRFSLSRYTTVSDIDIAIEKLPGVIANLRNISPFTPPEMRG